MDIVLEQLQREIQAALDGLDAFQTQLRPKGDAGRWSIQQIVEHLLLTYSLTANTFEVRIAKRSPTRATPSLQQRVGGFMLLRLGYFPRGRKAPTVVDPPAEGAARPGVELAGESGVRLARVDELAREAERLFGRRRAISHQVLGPLSAAEWRRFHLVHGEHHVKQIRAIRAAHAV